VTFCRTCGKRSAGRRISSDGAARFLRSAGSALAGGIICAQLFMLILQPMPEQGGRGGGQ